VSGSRRSYRAGAIAEAAAAVGMVFPPRLWTVRFAPSFRRDRPEFSYGTGAGAALIAEWALLLWRVLPRMRRQGWGRIVNISSIGGRLSFPGGAFYHGSKHGLEAISDVLRFELRPFGIQVVVIEPGFIRSGFAQAA
jgi:hypothetical protein